MFHFSNRVLEAASELRQVKDIVELGEVRRQFQSVCHGSTPGKDTERVNVARSQLAFDPEVMSAPHGSDTEIRVFTRLILHFTVIAVIVALLTGLSGFEIILHNANKFFRLVDKIRSEVGSFPSS